MRIMRRVTISDKPERREVLASLGVKYFASEPPVSPILIFDIDEGGPVWGQLSKLIPEWNVEDGFDPNNLGFVGTIFSKRDLRAASFLKLSAWGHGYPQPEGDFGYLKETYDLRDYCPACGIGIKQIAPFRMKGEPKWGKKHILQLNWVFDEFFVLPQVWETVFRPIGIGRSIVLNHRTGKPLQNVVQLIIDVAPSVLTTIADYPCEICDNCGRKKYLPICRGFHPSFEVDPVSQVCKTQELFGSGAEAWHATIVSSDMYKTIQSKKLVGAVFMPLKNKDASCACPLIL